jgi:hypothetical protein
MTGGAAVSRNDRIPMRARFAMASSQFANKRGVYLGRRSTKIHVALYGRSNGKGRWASSRLAGSANPLARPRRCQDRAQANLAADVPRGGRCRRGRGFQSWPADASCVVSQPQGEPRHHDSDRSGGPPRPCSRRNRPGARSTLAEVRGPLPGIRVLPSQRAESEDPDRDPRARVTGNCCDT